MEDEAGDRMNDEGCDECRWNADANDLTSVLTVQAVHLAEVQTATCGQVLHGGRVVKRCKKRREEGRHYSKSEDRYENRLQICRASIWWIWTMKNVCQRRT